MSEFVASSNLTKLLSAIFLFLVVVGALIVAVYDNLTGIQVNAYIMAVLGTGLGAAINILGIHVGAVTVQRSAVMLEKSKDAKDDEESL